MQGTWLAAVKLSVEGSAFLQGRRAVPPGELDHMAEFMVGDGLMSALEFLAWLAGQGVERVVLCAVVVERRHLFSVDAAEAGTWMPHYVRLLERLSYQSPFLRYEPGGGWPPRVGMDDAWVAFETMVRRIAGAYPRDDP